MLVEEPIRGQRITPADVAAMVAPLIAAARRSRGLTQATLAALLPSDTGRPRRSDYVAKLERRALAPSLPALLEIAHALGLTVTFGGHTLDAPKEKGER